MYTISHQYKSPNWNEREAAIDSIVVHSCEGRPLGNEQQSSIPWLCAPRSAVSSHYYVTREGIIYQLVSDEHRAWHAGPCTLAEDTNSCSIGIELEHALGAPAYPDIQREALTWLCRQLVAAYAIPLARVVSHRATALKPNGQTGRKQDPTDWSEPAFRLWVASLLPPASASYSETSPILGMTTTTPGEVYAALAHRFPTTLPPGSPNYTRADLRAILDAYWRVCLPVGVNPLLAVSQMLHETGYLVAFWSLRPQRNPAGIGVNGMSSQTEPPNPSGWAYNTQRQRWELGVSFKGWTQHSIPAHIGRLLAYALPPNSGTPAQRALIDRALSYRFLPSSAHGSAQTLKPLGRVHNPSGIGWSSPGLDYGQRIATIANQLVTETL